MTPTDEAHPASPADRVAAKMYALYCTLPRDEQAVFANLLRQVAVVQTEVAGYQTLLRQPDAGGLAITPAQARRLLALLRAGLGTA